jgi:tetratricopeptide (TPR) repeat protein
MQLPKSGWQKILHCIGGLVAVLAADALFAGSSADLRQLRFYPVPLAEATAPTDTTSATSATSWQTPTVDAHAFGADSLVRYQREIAALRDTEGAFAEPLVEPLTALARLHQQRGEHEQALSLLNEAVQIDRRHGGLYSDGQRALAEAMIVSLRAQRRYAEVDEKYRFLVELSSQPGAASAAGRAEALARLGEWKLESFQRQVALPDQGQRQAASLALGRLGSQQVLNTHLAELTEAQNCFVDAVRLLIESEDWTHPTLFAAERNLLRIFYADAHRELVSAPSATYAASLESARAGMRRKAAALDLGKPYQQGEAAYRRMIGYLKKNPAASVAAIAEVLQGLADWHLLFGKHAEAEAQYRQLQTFLELTATPAEQAQAILAPALPVTLPGFLDSPLVSAPQPDQPPFRGYVDFAFDVKPQGRAANLAVLGSSAGTDAAITDQLVALVQQSRFRPVPAGTAPVAVRYYYRY